MSGFGTSEESETPPTAEAVSWIEAALQAALGAEGEARGELARETLRSVRPDDVDAHLESWLEAVAAGLQTGAEGISSEAVEAVKARMLADRRQSLVAHGRLKERAIQNLVRRP